MEFKNGPISVFRLMWLSLSVANQAFGSALFMFFLVFVFFVLMALLVYLSHFISPNLPIILQIVNGLISFFISLIIPLALIQIIASKAEKTGMTAFDSLTSSVIPAFYYIASALIVGIPCVAVLLAALFSKSAIIMVAVYAAIFFGGLPFMFVQQTLVLRQNGPIEALKYSWELGRTFYGRILLNFFGALGVVLIVVLGSFCVIKLVLPQLAQQVQALANVPQQMLPFMLMGLVSQASKPILICGGIILAALYFYVFLSANAFMTIMFLNLDYSMRGVKNRELDGIPDQHFVPVQPVVAPTPTPEIHQHLGVNKSSVQAEDNPETTSRHLNQVYNAQEHLDRAIDQEEDRMPTILFDDDMLRQLAENEKQMKERAERKSQDPEDDGQTSIKMSDKPL